LFSGDSGTYENTINVWDLRTLDCIRALPGHTGAVYALAIVGNKLFSGSYDATIRVRCAERERERERERDAMTTI
jgi:WD40 repeat protein